MNAALICTIVIVCCIVAGVFETGRRKRNGKGKDNDRDA